MIPTGQAMWPDIFRRGVSRQRQIARAPIHTSCVSSTGQTGFISVQAPGRKCEKLERWPGECRRFRRKPNIRGSALVTAKGSRRAERAGFLKVNYAPIFWIFAFAGSRCNVYATDWCWCRLGCASLPVVPQIALKTKPTRSLLTKKVVLGLIG